MRAQEFLAENKQATARQVLAYINQTHHEPMTEKLTTAVQAHPRWELQQVPLRNLNIPDQDYEDPEQEPESDPYGRVMAVDPDHASEYSMQVVDRLPIVVDDQGYIIDGNHRAWAAAELLNRDRIQAWVPVKKDMAEGYLNEASSDEAWELVGQPGPEIQQFVKQMGYGNNEQSVAKIISIIDKVQPTQITAASIPKLKNLANKGNDVQTLKAIQQISGRPDAAQQYARLMQARDAGEGRNRGYPVGDLIQAVKSGNYDPPVLLKLPTGIYVIGGRTRLYAALALGVPANVKIISANNFKQDMAENFADGKVKGKSRPGRVKRSGASCNGSVTDLRARAKRASGEKARMYHWCANMKSGKKK